MPIGKGKYRRVVIFLLDLDRKGREV